MQSRCLKPSRTFHALILLPALLALDPAFRVLQAQDLDPGLEALFLSETEDESPEPDAPAPKSALRDWLTLGGYLKNETAYRFREPRSITKIRNIAALNGQYSPDRDLRLVFSAWAYHDLAYDLFAYETISARFARDDDQPLVFIDNLEQEKDSPVAELREFYLDMYFDRIDVRIGKQFVIWGVFEGVRITDEINPLDFRELILPDLLDYRVPQWTLKLDYYGDIGDFQFLWIPDIRFHKPAPRGSEWELLQDIRDEDDQLITRYPPRTFRNSDVGLRYTSSFIGSDISLSYLYTWDNFPVVFRSALIDSVLDPDFFPTYTRINMYGATLVRPVGRGVVKTEIAYVPDKYFGLSADTDRDGDGFLDDQGAVQKRHIRWGFGYDFARWGIDFSPAISQWIILDYDDQLIQHQYDTSLTLFARKPVPEYNAVIQLLAIGLVSLDELYLKPKAIFNVTNRFQIATGADLFFGRRSQLGAPGGGAAIIGASAFEQAQFFGNFNNNDRLFLEFRYSF
jgi:hypothetical protein